MKISDRPYYGIYNMDEAEVPPYELPSPLLAADGKTVRNAFEWMNSRRGELLNLFRDEMYGWILPRPDKMHFELLSEKRDALGGIAVRKEIRIHCGMNNGESKSFDLLLYYPNDAKSPVPVFLGANGRGNHATTPEEDVRITKEPVVNWSLHEAFATAPPDESTRGVQTEFWNFHTLVERGYAGATLCISELFYDSPEAFPESIFKLFLSREELQKERQNFGAIGAWAWGLSRALDCLENEPALDSKRVAVHGHSRLGKTALWAGSIDPRFAMIISNESGCAGASLSRRIFGETIDYLLFWRSYWFSSAFQRYRNNEQNLPFDQHFLIALAAPRPVYVASAAGDLHSDPRGEYLAAVGASVVYRLFGAGCKELDPEKLPPQNVSIGHEIGYHIRSGEHDVTAQDWDFYLNFADRHFQTRKEGKK